jgi:enterochelin esterase-like enzyme
MKRSLILAVLVASLVVVGWTTTSTSAPGGRELDADLRSQALGGKLKFAVYLPQEYDGAKTRYPVVYFLHGLPAGPDGYRNASFVSQALDRLGRPAIVVAPQGSRTMDADPEYLGAWEKAIAKELPRVVDSRFRTIRDRSGRALVGVSAGGYGAMLLALHNLDSFAVVESWSGYFHPTNPDGTAALDLGSASANAHASAHSFVPTLKRAVAAKPTFIGFYVGSGDDRFRSENVQLDRELSDAGIPHVFRLYSGGHDQTVWSTHAPQWLSLALNHLARPRG